MWPRRCRRESGAAPCGGAAGGQRHGAGQAAAVGRRGPRAPHGDPQRRHPGILRRRSRRQPLQRQLRCGFHLLLARTQISWHEYKSLYQAFSTIQFCPALELLEVVDEHLLITSGLVVAGTCACLLRHMGVRLQLLLCRHGSGGVELPAPTQRSAGRQCRPWSLRHCRQRCARCAGRPVCRPLRWPAAATPLAGELNPEGP